MVKRRRSDLTEETIIVINKLIDLDNSRSTQLAQQFRDLLSAEEKPAGEFTFDEIIQVFGLNYTIMEQHIWKIEDSELDFTMTPYFMTLMNTRAKNFDRSSDAFCRTALAFILNECLTVIKGNHIDHTISGFDDLRVYGEVAFNHKVLETSPILSVSGRLDYGIGRVIYYCPERRFQCFLVIVKAKVRSSVGLAVPQLLAYLACLRHSRLKRNRTDASVYGVASDGDQFVFVTIAHDGTVKISETFDVLRGKLLKVLGWLKFILKTVANSTHCGDENDGEDFDDPPIDLDDNDYTNPPEEED